MDREEVTGNFIAELFTSSGLNGLIGDCVTRTIHSNKRKENNSYGFDLIKYLRGGVFYTSGRFTDSVNLNRDKRPLPSYQFYSPESSDSFFFLAISYFGVAGRVPFNADIPNALRNINRDLGFDTRPIGIMGTVYDNKKTFLLLWQSLADRIISSGDFDGIMELSIKRMKEDPATFFESYDVPPELRELPTREKAEIWKLCHSYILAKGIRDKGYNASVLRFIDGKVLNGDLKTLEPFAFGVYPLAS